VGDSSDHSEEVANLSSEEICEALLTQLGYVTLGETQLASLEGKHVHEGHDEDATFVATGWGNVMQVVM